MKDYGSKVLVYRGKAKQTEGGLKKKDIIRVKDILVQRRKDEEGNIKGCKRKVVYRYKSNKQQTKSPKVKSQKARTKWSLCLEEGRKAMYKKFPKSKGQFVLVLNPSKTYKRGNEERTKWGKFLYESTKKCYNKKTV